MGKEGGSVMPTPHDIEIAERYGEDPSTEYVQCDQCGEMDCRGNVARCGECGEAWCASCLGDMSGCEADEEITCPACGREDEGSGDCGDDGP